MRRLLVFAMVLGSLLSLPAVSRAGTVYNFYGEDENGVGSATMTFTVTGNKLEVVLENTSPTLTQNGNLNKPAIIGFGFDLVDPIPALLSWTLHAFNTSNVEVLLGSGSASESWQLGAGGVNGGGHGKVELDYYPHTTPPDGKLYNPALLANSAIGSENFFTTATLVMEFDDTPELYAWLDSKKDNVGSPYVRMQEVGDNAKGSLKLVGTEGYEPPIDFPGGVPEPGAIVVWGLLGLVGLGWRLKNRSAA